MPKFRLSRVLSTTKERKWHPPSISHLPVDLTSLDSHSLLSLANLNVTTDDEFLQYIKEFYVFNATDCQLQSIATAYPNGNAAFAAPFGGNATQDALSPQYMRLAAFQTDWIFSSRRRHMLDVLSRTQPTYSFREIIRTCRAA
jgi:hypothetical protein